MKGRKGFTLIELLVVIAIIAVLAAILFPVFARARAAAATANCQSNMSQIGRAMKMYVQEWHDMYPSQDYSQSPGVPNSNVQLSWPGNITTDGKPVRYQYGTNWVEALQPYMEAISKDSSGAWKCGAAASKTDPPSPVPKWDTAAVNYAMNANLVDQPEGVIRSAANLLAVREMDRKVNSVLRPYNVSSDSTKTPAAPFLTNTDTGLSALGGQATIEKEHGPGSNIRFADSHVKMFPTNYFPHSPAFATYDATDTAWYNFSGVNSDALRAKSISITP
jgi:prepilin-type N-terminal cleavage/methylation domain-containing protein